MEKIRMKGTLIRNDNGAEKKEGEAVVNFLVDELGLDLGGYSSVEKRDDGIWLIKQLVVGGLVHYSQNEINTFTRDKAISRGGKYGERGTYFGAGNLEGETFDQLVNTPGIKKHEVGFCGDFVVIENDQVRAYKEKVDMLLNRDKPRVKTAIQNADLLTLTSEDPKLSNVDGIFVKTASDNSAELVVKDSSIEQVVTEVKVAT